MPTINISDLTKSFNELKRSHANDASSAALLTPLLEQLATLISSSQGSKDVSDAERVAIEAWNLCVDASNQLAISKIPHTAAQWSELATIRSLVLQLLGIISKSQLRSTTFDRENLLIVAKASASAWMDLQQYDQAEKALSSLDEFEKLPLDLQLLHLNLLLRIDSPSFSSKAQLCYEECEEASIGHLGMKFLEMGIDKAEMKIYEEGKEGRMEPAVMLISLALDLLQQVSAQGAQMAKETIQGPITEAPTPEDIKEGKIMALSWLLFLHVKLKDGPKAAQAYDNLIGIDVNLTSDPLITSLSILARAMVPRRAEEALQDLVALASDPESTEQSVMSLIRDLIGVLSLESLAPVVQILAGRIKSPRPIISFSLTVVALKISKKEEYFANNLLLEAAKIQPMEEKEKGRLRIATFNRAVVLFNKGKHSEAVSLWKCCAVLCDEPCLADLKSTCFRHACLSSLASGQSHESCLELLDQSDLALGGRKSIKTIFFRFKVFLECKNTDAAVQIVKDIKDCEDFHPAFLEVLYDEANGCHAWPEVREILILLYSSISKGGSSEDASSGQVKEGRVLISLIHSITKDEKGDRGQNHVELARWIMIAAKRLESIGLEDFFGSSTEEDLLLAQWLASTAYQGARDSLKLKDFKSSCVLLGAAALIHKVLFGLDPSCPHKAISLKMHLMACSGAIEVFMTGGHEGSLGLATNLFATAKSMEAEMAGQQQLKGLPTLYYFLDLVLSLLNKDWAAIDLATAHKDFYELASLLTLPQLLFLLDLSRPFNNCLSDNLPPASFKLWELLSDIVLGKEVALKSPNLDLCSSILYNQVKSAADDAKSKLRLSDAVRVLSMPRDNHQGALTFPVDRLKGLIVHSWNLGRERLREGQRNKGGGLEFMRLAISLACLLPDDDSKKGEWMTMMNNAYNNEAEGNKPEPANKEHMLV